jgi:NAD(P)-dependent dehydrogenase (short-subunit alcohol dehydrogenase family)
VSSVVVSHEAYVAASLEGKVKDATAIHGRIDVLINNAGVSVRAPAMETKASPSLSVLF